MNKTIRSATGLMVAVVVFLAAAAPAQAVNTYLKIDSIPGESTDAKHKNEIDVTSFSFAATVPPLPGGAATDRNAGGVKISELKIVKAVDAASAKLFMACCKGQRLKSAELIVTRGAGKGETMLRYRFTDVAITSVHVQGGEEAVVEEIKISFATIEIEYTSPEGKTVKEGWNVKENKATSSTKKGEPDKATGGDSTTEKPQTPAEKAAAALQQLIDAANKKENKDSSEPSP